MVAISTLLYALLAGLTGVYILHKLNKPGRKHKKTYKPPDQTTIPKVKKDKDTILHSSDPDQARSIFLAQRGHAARTPATLPTTFQKAVTKHANYTAFMVEEKQADNTYTWKQYTYKEYYELSKKAAKAFIKIGLNRYQGVSIIGFNSPEWLISHMGTILAGGLSAGIYTTNKTDSCKYIVNHSQSVAVVCEDIAQLTKFVKIANEMPTVKAIIIYKEKHVEEYKKQFPFPLFTWKEFIEFGSSEEEQKNLDERIASQKPNHACSLIYTSGTTGPPKAVMISHDNATWTGGLMKTVLPDWGEHPERLVSYLPLSHIAAQLADIYFPVCSSAFHKQSVTLYFARPDALKGSLAGTLKYAKPTLFFGVPRVWEKFMERMIAVGKKSGSIAQSLAQYAKKVGLQHWEACQTYGYDYRAPIMYHIMKLLVYDRIKEAMGLQDCRICITGAAPISLETLKYLGSLDIHIHNLYGLSETTGPITCTRPDFFRAGSAGAPLEGMELKIDHVAGRDKEGEGEICFRGRNMMIGYLRDPVKTKDAFDDEGFFHSGDVGRVDKTTGMLYITGRIKELIITAGGENVAPVPIEETLLKEIPALSNAMLVGDHRKFNSVLVTLKVDIDEKTGQPTDKLAREALSVSSAKTVAEAKNDPAWKAYIEAGIKRYNTQAVSSAQSVQKFAIIDRDFSVPGGELTETLKLKRSVVVKMYEDIIDGLYGGGEDGEK